MDLMRRALPSFKDQRAKSNFTQPNPINSNFFVCLFVFLGALCVFFFVFAYINVNL